MYVTAVILVGGASVDLPFEDLRVVIKKRKSV